MYAPLLRAELFEQEHFPAVTPFLQFFYVYLWSRSVAPRPSYLFSNAADLPPRPRLDLLVSGVDFDRDIYFRCADLFFLYLASRHLLSNPALFFLRGCFGPAFSRFLSIDWWSIFPLLFLPSRRRLEEAPEQLPPFERFLFFRSSFFVLLKENRA